MRISDWSSDVCSSDLLSNVGITNAFATTRQGVSAEDSLRQIKRDLVFLGIGAKKLTDSVEFDAMLARCAASNGHAKFLLSSLQNPALEELARRNKRDDLSYRRRVMESIREIFKRATEAGVEIGRALCRDRVCKYV